MSARFHLSPDNPLPDGAEAGTLRAADKRSIRFATFPAAPSANGGRPRGTLLLLSGRNETIEKYFETIADLTALGYMVAALDWRGQGGSDRLLADPMRGHVRSFDDYAGDLDLLMREVVLPLAPRPLFLFAHSTGALVALLAVRSLEATIQRMVFAAPFLGFTGVSASFAAIHGVAKGMSMLGLGSRYLGGGPKSRLTASFDGNPLTSDPHRFARNRQILQSFPLLGLGGPTAAWVRAACDAILAVSDPAYAASVRIPTLLVAAGSDRVVSTPAAEAYAGKLPFGALLTIDGARHEILQEADRFRDQFFAAFDAFIPGSAEADAGSGSRA